MRFVFTSVFIIISVLFFSCADDEMIPDPMPPTGSTDICPDLSGQALIDCIINNYTPTTSFTYAEARDHMYSNVDVWDDGLVHTIYTDFTITVDPNGSSPRGEAFGKGVNTEHIFPQSMGANEVPARSDIFHIFPSRENVNSARGNHPFSEINDATTDKWYFQDNITSSIPSISIDDYSEGTTNLWEPREEVKGDVARAVFYFYSIHNNVANGSFFNGMKNDLLNWHLNDPVSERERQRNDKIKLLQGNDNPFILSAELAGRVVDN